MIELIETNREAIVGLCRQYGVQKLAVFGSAINGQFDPATSDLDFVVDLGTYERGVSRRFLGLFVDLEKLFDRQIDLVTRHDGLHDWFRNELDTTAVTIFDQPPVLPIWAGLPCRHL